MRESANEAVLSNLHFLPVKLLHPVPLLPRNTASGHFLHAASFHCTQNPENRKRSAAGQFLSLPIPNAVLLTDLPALFLRPAKYHLCQTIVWKNVSHGTLRKKSKPKLPESEVIL